jgi:hypothetical protein
MTASGHDMERSAIFAVIAEHLGVRYVYDESPLPDEPDAAETVATRERLAELPADVVDQLHRAVLEGDVEAAALAVDRVRECDGTAADTRESVPCGV